VFELILAAASFIMSTIGVISGFAFAALSDYRRRKSDERAKAHYKEMLAANERARSARKKTKRGGKKRKRK